MKISIVIPAFNEEKLIGRCLDAVRTAGAAIRDRGWGLEVIVCDNNSSDRTGEIAASLGATVVREPVNQIARARNSGAAVASGDWLLFLDADSFPSRELLHDMAEAIDSGEHIGGGSYVELDDYVGRVKFWVDAWNWFSRNTGIAAGSFLFCERSAFVELGGFDQELYVSEELDLSRRLKRFGRIQGKSMAILSRHPLRTSARKLHLYTRVEYLRFLARCVCSPFGARRRREACPIWYDGRR